MSCGRLVGDLWLSLHITNLRSIENETQVCTFKLKICYICLNCGRRSSKDMSSRYPKARGEVNLRRAGWSGRQNNKGPNGSPCCGPTIDRIVYLPNFN